MTRSSRTRRGSIWEEAAIREFIDGNSTSEQSGRRTISPSTIKELLRNIQGLELEDQTKIVDRVDQVSGDYPLFPPWNLPFILQRCIRLSTRKMPS